MDIQNGKGFNLYKMKLEFNTERGLNFYIIYNIPYFEYFNYKKEVSDEYKESNEGAFTLNE
jgi:hypothetical protein